jgi:ankyrin repeat protein
MMVVLLVQKGVNVKTENGRRALIQVVKDGDTESAKALLDAGVEATQLDKEGHSALWYAVTRRNLGLAKLFVEHVDQQALSEALYWVLEAAKDNTWFLQLELEDLCYPVLELLVEEGADVTTKHGERTLLHLAMRMPKAVRLLMKKGADINKKYMGQSVLYAAVEGGNWKTVELLVQEGADINTKYIGKSVLYAAVEGGNREIVELLVQKGADVNTMYEDETVLEAALAAAERKSHCWDVVELLLRNGANINNVYNNFGGMTLVHHLVGVAPNTLMELLVDKCRESINDKDEDGMTALHHALDASSTLPLLWKNVGLLLKNGARADELDNKGQTPKDLLILNGNRREGDEEKYDKLLTRYGS